MFGSWFEYCGEQVSPNLKLMKVALNRRETDKENKRNFTLKQLKWNARQKEKKNRSKYIKKKRCKRINSCKAG